MDFWADFWGIIVWFFWVFVFIAYLMALFSVIGDLFRDHKLNGWLKAIWFIALIFVPFLTVFVYLIARGKGMGERSQKQAQEYEAASAQYIRSVASSSPSEEIAKGKALLDSGAITQAEFDKIKAHALSATGAATATA